MITRFAPSPTGPLHLGHACSAILAHDMARAAGGQFLLRFEDIDRQRFRPEWEAAALADLAWLGLQQDAPPLRQSTRLPAHDAALLRLWKEGLLYPCTCTRRDIAESLSAPQEVQPPRTTASSHARHRPDTLHAQMIGPDGPVYPGTCRARLRPTHMPDDAHLRLDMAAALDRIAGRALSFIETGPRNFGTVTTTPAQYCNDIGDIVLARRDFGTSYHLAVTIDDAAQGITHVVRGEDLFTATRVHILLQVILGLPTPQYHHHRLIRDEHGHRLAKRDNARALSRYRDDGATPGDIRRMVGLCLGQINFNSIL